MSKSDERETPDWVYIAGRGHSGSTMLDAMLGNVTGIESVGELVSGMGRYDELCSCGRTFRDCDYWKAVRRHFGAESGRLWDAAVDLCKKQAHIKAFPKTLMATPGSAWVQELTETTNAIGVAIAHVSGCYPSSGEPTHSGNRNVSDGPPHGAAVHPSLVADSSKEITRALFFLRFFRTARVIHLMRHPVSILQSDYFRLKSGVGFKFLRRRYFPTRFFGPALFVSVFTWITGNLLADLTRLYGKDRFLRVRYESIINDPMKQIDRIERFLNTPIDEVRTRIQRDEPFEIGHNIGGNHMRLGGTFRFDPGRSKRTGLPMRFVVMAWLMTWPLLIVYGYRGSMFPPTGVTRG